MPSDSNVCRVEQPNGRPSPPPTLAYVAGTAYSSSTLVSFLLNTHPMICAIGEMHAPVYPKDNHTERLCSCGNRMGECPFFNEMASRLSQKGINFDPIRWNLAYMLPQARLLSQLMLGSLRNTSLETIRNVLWQLYPAYRRRLTELDQQNEQFIMTALELRGARVFVDANKDPIRIFHLKRIDSLKMKVIHLIRDPRAYICSVLTRRPQSPVKRFARWWRRCNKNIDRHLVSLSSDSWMRLQYESLCTNPQQTLAKIGEFLGVGAIEVPSDYRATEHHIMGNKMRLSEDRRTIKPLDERWRTNLSPKDTAIVTAIAGPLARKYGYDI
ncbi:MAG: sulfotransferase family protein [Planctomycetota bacterium]